MPSAAATPVPPAVVPPASQSAPPDSEALIERIRRQYAGVNARVAEYTSRDYDLVGFSAEGGVLHAFYDANRIAKLVAEFYGEGGQAVEEYYYWDRAIASYPSSTLSK